jgi:hypothetical protein
MIRWLFLMLLFLHFPLLSRAQENLKSREEQIRFEEKQQQVLAAQEKGRKRHESIQQKKVRKRMKESLKKSRKVNENRKPFFLSRLFRRR